MRRPQLATSCFIVAFFIQGQTMVSLFLMEWLEPPSPPETLFKIGHRLQLHVPAFLLHSSASANISAVEQQHYRGIAKVLEANNWRTMPFFRETIGKIGLPSPGQRSLRLRELARTCANVDKKGVAPQEKEIPRQTPNSRRQTKF